MILIILPNQYILRLLFHYYINEFYFDRLSDFNLSAFSIIDRAPLFLILLSVINSFFKVLFCIKAEPIFSAASSPKSLSCKIRVSRLVLDKIILANTRPPSPEKLFLRKLPSHIPSYIICIIHLNTLNNQIELFHSV